MKRLGIISDTHGYWDERYAKYFASVDEIWHAGDIGSMLLAERIAQIAPLRAVYGNCDGGDLRRIFPEKLCRDTEGAEILMKHIGGYPGNYDSSIREQIFRKPPQLFISGHSHILKIQYDSQLHLLHINPGAAGLQGWQTVRTLVRLTVDKGRFSDIEVIEMPRSKGRDNIRPTESREGAI